jgi:signal transduction histidine kinase
MGTSTLLVLVSLLVVGAMIWLLKSATGPLSFQDQTNLLLLVAGFDLLIASFITTTVILLGQAVVSFEVFTEKSFPRREFQRQWRNAIILATGYSIVVGWGLTQQIRTIYILLVTTLLMTLFFALSSWRAYTWRDRYLRHLRPFITSQRLYDYLLAPVPSEVGVDLPFRALCEEVLRSQFAYLIPLGPLAPLVQPLSYPEKEKEPPTLPQGLIARFQSPEVICLPLEPQEAGGAVWAIPLWSERGLIGLFLLGPKRDKGLYTQEEIEIAQASGERLIDTRASAEIAQQLMRLQRQRLVESQVLDRQTRRVLHDEVLPDLHTALLVLNGGGETAEAVKLLTEAHHQISTILQAMPATTVPHLERLGLIGALTHVVTDELKGAFEEVAWQIEPEARQVAEQLPSLPTYILFYATREVIRNAAKHGRNGHEDQPLRLNISLSGVTTLTICVEDDGVGITSPMNAPSGGSGQGLALHSTMLAVIGGSLEVESVAGAYTRVTISCN